MMKIELRQSQVMTTFGVGSIIDLDCQSFMPAMIETWNGGNIEDEIKDDALVNRLQQYFPNLRELRRLPILDEHSISLVRFPSWLYCPKCKELKPYYEWLGLWNARFTEEKKRGYFRNHPRCSKCAKESGYGHNLLAVRFVVACSHGHIDDFPWVEWCHKNGNICAKPELTISTNGSAGLSGIIVKCKCGEKNNMELAFNKDELAQITHCKGTMPWKGIENTAGGEKKWHYESCGEQLQTLQRGGSNVHFPVIHSAITIPPVSNWEYNKVLSFSSTHMIIDDYKESCQHSGIEGDFVPEEDDASANTSIDEIIETYSRQLRRESDRASISFDKAKQIISQHCTPDSGNKKTEEQILFEEFQAMSNPNDISLDRKNDNNLLQVTKQDTSTCTNGIIGNFIDRVCMVTRLREVIVMSAFTRILSSQDARSVDGKHVTQQKIAENNTAWLPACESFGEGVFIRFDADKIEQWASQEGIAACMNQISQEQIKPKAAKILLHTLSHCLMKEFSFYAGYSLTSLKERIYCCENSLSDQEIRKMYGILIYTTAADKYGTMGGLVKLGEVKTLEPLLRNAIKNSLFCSNDPLCREHPSGPNSYAACFACTFVPETSCRMFNHWLDRRMLINEPSKQCSLRGLFNDFV